MSDFTNIRNWSNDRLVDNDNDPDALFKAKNAEKRRRCLVHMEEQQKAEEVQECRKAAEAEECQKVVEAHCKAAEEAAKKRVSVLMFPDKQC